MCEIMIWEVSLVQKRHFRKKWLKIKKKVFCNFILEFFLQFKSVLSMSKFQNHCTLPYSEPSQRVKKEYIIL
jgi:hypothetical protein